MKKRNGKLFVILGICVIVLLITSMLITAANEEEQSISEKIENNLGGVYDYVENFIEKRGINSEDINNITEVDFEDLPKEVNIENVDDTNLAIYQIDYDKSSEKQEKVFVVTYSVEKLNTQGDLIIAQDKREFLTFGSTENMIKSGFLKSAAGVEGSLDKGYVMMRYGSITGISTSLEILEGKGTLEIIIYKNGELINFGNTIVADSAGAKKDYDTQSKDIVSFEPGDVISLYARSSGEISWKDVTTLIEIVTN